MKLPCEQHCKKLNIGKLMLINQKTKSNILSYRFSLSYTKSVKFVNKIKHKTF